MSQNSLVFPVGFGAASLAAYSSGMDGESSEGAKLTDDRDDVLALPLRHPYDPPRA